MRHLSEVLERIRNVPGLKRDVIALVVLVAVGIICGGYIVLHNEWVPPWEDRFVFSADFEKAPGVYTDAAQEVRIAGVKVGKVVSAEPRVNGNARLTFSLEEGHTVYDNARVVWRMKSPLNVMYATLDPGGPPGRPLSEGEAIPVTQTERAIQPFEILDKLDGRTRSAVTALLNQADVALANAPQKLPNGLRATKNTIAKFQPVVENLEKRRDYIAELVTSLSQIAKAAGGDQQRLARLTTSLQETLGTLAHRDDDLKETIAELPGFSKKLQAAMASTSKLTTQLNPTLENIHGAADELPSALSRLSDTVREAGPVIKRASPLVEKAKPVVHDLRPLVSDVNSALDDLSPVTGHLPDATKQIVPWMDHLAAFVYHTSSSFSLADRNGGFGRANITLDVTNPTGGGDGATPPERERPNEGGN